MGCEKTKQTHPRIPQSPEGFSRFGVTNIDELQKVFFFLEDTGEFMFGFQNLKKLRSLDKNPNTETTLVQAVLPFLVGHPHIINLPNVKNCMLGGRYV